jgi:protein-disulfide isomerase
VLSKLATISLVAIFSLSGPYPQQDEIAALRKEIEGLKAQQAAMQRDLDAIKAFLQALVQGGKPAEERLVNSSIAIAGEPVRGAATAKITMVEISDYHCPFCRRHIQQTQPQIDAEYVNTGRLRHVFIDYPIEQLHPEAFKAHEAANCAAEQGKFWDLHRELFLKPTRETTELVQQAQTVGLEATAFKSCLESGKYSASVRESVTRMQQLGIDSTPMFLIGLTPPEGQPMKILKVVRGAHPFAQFRTTFDSLNE